MNNNTRPFSDWTADYLKAEGIEINGDLDYVNVRMETSFRCVTFSCSTITKPDYRCARHFTDEFGDGQHSVKIARNWIDANGYRIDGPIFSICFHTAEAAQEFACKWLRKRNGTPGYFGLVDTQNRRRAAQEKRMITPAAGA